ncbi:MAG TPA: hypothetical protein VH253_04360 [Phycisphaerae bacterium]|nr:hypothetical protein [Phycisphaerae bacterium]
MAVAHTVLHAYGSWHPDHPSGWHQHGENMPLRPDFHLGKRRRASQRWTTVHFPVEVHGELVDLAADICRRRGWQFHAIALTPSHMHLVYSWRTGLAALDTQAVFKRILGWKLAKLSGVSGRRWFSDGGRPKLVRSAEHLAFLLEEYLPDQADTFFAVPHRLTW